MKATFRVAVPEDRPSWVALRFELWPECPIKRHELEVGQLLSSPGVVVLAEYDSQLIGFAEVSIRGDHVEGTSAAPVPYLEGWYVRPALRGRGIGRGLFAFVEQWAIDHGYRELASDAEIENLRSVKLHGQLEFVEVGRSVHFVKKLKCKDGYSGLNHAKEPRTRSWG
jgi:aminoglycoside 6'-N-acetyltransferase I